MDRELQNYLNNIILKQASKLNYIVKDFAPNTEKDLFNSTSLVIWSGESDNTIFGDAKINYAFRALHDDLHLKTRLDFNPESEIELGRIQASKYSGIIADIVYCEVSGQAEYYKNNGIFVKDQVLFFKEYMKELGHGL